MKIILIFNLILCISYTFFLNENLLIYNDKDLYYEYVIFNEGLFFKVNNFINWKLSDVINYFYSKINVNDFIISDCNKFNDIISFKGYIIYGYINSSKYYYFIPKKLIKEYNYCKLNNQRNMFIWIIRTTYKDYRYENIVKALNRMPKIFKKGEILDLYRNIFRENDYKIGYALIYSGSDIILEEIAGGGVCGVSSLYYQVFSRLSGFQILERYPHTVFYYEYYNYPGLDSTIYGNGIIPYKNLKIKNNFDDIYIEPFYWTDYKNFNYGLKIISKKEIKYYDVKTISSGKCFINEFYDEGNYIKSIKSCYKEIK